MIVVVYIASSLYVVASVAFVVAALRIALRKPPAQPKQEPSQVWVLHVQEALEAL